MDGPLVAYATGDTTSGCHKVVAWNVLSGAATRVSGPRAGRCFSDQAHGQRVTQLAVAGQRLAWVRSITGNTEADDYLYAASLPRPQERKLAAVRRVGEPPSQGGAISGLVGDGHLLAATVTKTGSAGTATALQALTPWGARTVASGPGAFAARSADLGRVAALGQEGVAVFSAAGQLLRTVADGGQEVALRKDYLVVLRRGRLDVYNANTGGYVRSWPVAAEASLLDVHSGIAIYAVWRRLHALRLQTGKDVVVAAAPRRLVGAQIEAPGLVYAYNTSRAGRERGNLVFLPLAQLIAALA
jgi:hypothetical protein